MSTGESARPRRRPAQMSAGEAVGREKRKLPSESKPTSSKRPRERLPAEGEGVPEVPSLDEVELPPSNRGSHTGGGEYQLGEVVIESTKKKKEVKKTKDDIARDEAKAIADEIEKWFPFGDRIFEIPVGSFVAPPASLVCRLMNTEHCRNILNNMLKAAVQEPEVAIVVPYNPRRSCLVNIRSLPNYGSSFVGMMEHFQFFAISGQHSAEAAKLILKRAETNPGKYGAAAKRLALRKCRILDGACPTTTLVKYSDAMNFGKKQIASFSSPVHQRLLHARLQYQGLKCPPRPSTVAKGPERKKADEQWKVGQVCCLDYPVIEYYFLVSTPRCGLELQRRGERVSLNVNV